MKHATVTFITYVNVQVEVTEEEHALLEQAVDAAAPSCLTKEQRELTDKILTKADREVNSSAEIRVEQPCEIEPLTVSISDAHIRYNVREF